MADDMAMDDYLAAGGKVTAPFNLPTRYRAELMKLMATFVDSEMAGAAGFADIINEGPGIKERIAASRIVLEKTDHAERVLNLMGEFGTDTTHYVSQHPWTARLARDAAIGTRRSNHDMRLAVFNYPIEGWADAVVMNLLMGHAVMVQLADFVKVSYQPLADAFRAIAPREERHMQLAQEGAIRLLETGTPERQLQEAVDYWWPRVAPSFGSPDEARIERLRKWGLRHADGDAMLEEWEANAGTALAELGLSRPMG